MVIAREEVESAARGDRESQRHIYELLIDRIYRTVFRIVGASDVDDVSQDVFLQLFANLHQFRFESDFLTWTHRLAVNQALQHLRRRKRTLVVSIESLEVGPMSTQGDPDLKELFDVALSRLDAELRLILDLKESQQLPYSEIAEIVGIPEGTVGSRLNRARRELKSHLLSLGWEE
ncbi:MAG TPA: RNA polymerase sigma factor [Planctomycetaceae bacterium]|jgi:RNA polymerase sigma-70 factor (ECF subfamily)|nr:RNA polymerase sigma factor [Planctomycetaceae bacterium]